MGPRMIVTVFGGSQPKQGSDAYTQAVTLGSLLAKAGHTVVTGGYMGTMEAVSQGAYNAGGHTIGITCAQIEEWRGTPANAWVKEERKAGTLLERLGELITVCDAAIALPGGPGTLAEISLMWNLMIIQALPQKRLILVGDGWQRTLDSFHRTLGNYSNPGQQALLSHTATVTDAFNALAL